MVHSLTIFNITVRTQRLISTVARDN